MVYHSLSENITGTLLQCVLLPCDKVGRLTNIDRSVGQDCFKYGPSKTWISGQNIIETHSNLRLFKESNIKKGC